MIRLVPVLLVLGALVPVVFIMGARPLPKEDQCVTRRELQAFSDALQERQRVRDETLGMFAKAITALRDQKKAQDDAGH